MSCLTLCDPIDCSMPGFPVLYHLLEFAQTHVHWVGDAIQPSEVSHFAQIGRLPPNTTVSLSLSTSSVPGILVDHIVSDTCCCFNSKRLILTRVTNWYPLEPCIFVSVTHCWEYMDLSHQPGSFSLFTSLPPISGDSVEGEFHLLQETWGSRTPNLEVFCKPV